MFPIFHDQWSKLSKFCPFETVIYTLIAAMKSLKRISTVRSVLVSLSNARLIFPAISAVLHPSLNGRKNKLYQFPFFLLLPIVRQTTPLPQSTLNRKQTETIVRRPFSKAVKINSKRYILKTATYLSNSLILQFCAPFHDTHHKIQTCDKELWPAGYIHKCRSKTGNISTRFAEERRSRCKTGCTMIFHKLTRTDVRTNWTMLNFRAFDDRRCQVINDPSLFLFQKWNVTGRLSRALRFEFAEIFIETHSTDATRGKTCINFNDAH